MRLRELYAIRVDSRVHDLVVFSVHSGVVELEAR